MHSSSSSIEAFQSGKVTSVGSPDLEARSLSLPPPVKSDSVTLSSAANLVELAKASITSRQAKLDHLGALVKSGSYQSDADQVSHAVVESHLVR